jgi:hypothetical protein
MEEEYVIQPDNEEAEVQDESPEPDGTDDAVDEKTEINRLLDEGYTSQAGWQTGHCSRVSYQAPVLH